MEVLSKITNGFSLGKLTNLHIVCQEVSNFYKRRVCSTVTEMFIKLHKDCDFSIQRNNTIQETEILFLILNKRHVIMESCTIVVWVYH